MWCTACTVHTDTRICVVYIALYNVQKRRSENKQMEIVKMNFVTSLAIYCVEFVTNLAVYCVEFVTSLAIYCVDGRQK